MTLFHLAYFLLPAGLIGLAVLLAVLSGGRDEPGGGRTGGADG